MQIGLRVECSVVAWLREDSEGGLIVAHVLVSLGIELELWDRGLVLGEFHGFGLPCEKMYGIWKRMGGWG